MNNYIFLIIGFVLIFSSILFFINRFRKTKLTIQDYYFWFKIEKKFFKGQEKFFKILQISKEEFLFIWLSLKEKFLRRIKIEALKIESWAGKKLEDMKKQNNLNDAEI